MERVIIRQALSQATDACTYAPLANTLGFTSVKRPIDYLSDSSSEIAKRLKPLAKSLFRVGAYESQVVRAGLWVAILPKWGDINAERERARRRITKALVELAPAGDRNVLLILAAEGVDDIELVLPRQRSKGALGTVRALINKSDPTRHHLELFESLILKPGDETAAITRRWTDAFNVEKVTKSFYLEFRALRDRIVEVIKSNNPKNPLLAVADEDEAARAEVQRYVTRNLGRVLFLWFIQSKDWLDGDSHYLLNLYNTRCRIGRDHNFYRETLIPLFFDALAKKPKDRPEIARSLGDVPYLNGGLFVQTTFEDRLYGDERERLDVAIPNDVFDPRVHDPKTPTVLGLLSSYRFTTRESTPDNLSLDPDPELLGKVFENLNEDRKKTGTYYTPREVVRFICREALDGYLHHVTGVTSETLDALRLEALDPAATDIRLSAEERTRLEKALLEVKVCDPAVGSGAFPVGMLQEITQLLIGIEQSTDVSVSVGGQRVAEWKEKIITNCLYGVDINPEAVEICHLRLWLSMVIDADRPVPLPNLDFRFEAGDSLVDRIAELRLLNSLPEEKERALALDSASNALQDLERLRAQYALANDPIEARRLRTAIREVQLNSVRAQIEELIGRCRDTLRGRHAKLTEMRRLSAQPAHSRKAQKEAEDLAKRIKILDRFREHLAPDAPYKKPFLWPVEFSEVFEKGGFDIVVANPPYVRQEKLAPEDQQAYAASFPEVYTGTADLYVYFYARALQLIRVDGHLAFITSNSFTKRSYGLSLMALLEERTKIRRAIDFGELSVFDATVEPYILVAQVSKPSGSECVKGHNLYAPLAQQLPDGTNTVSTVREALDDFAAALSLDEVNIAQKQFAASGWRIEPSELTEVWKKMVKSGTPLGEFLHGRMYYGIKTGLNEAFVVDEAKRAELIAADPRSADLIKPWLRGKDIKRWRPNWSGLYVIAIQNSGDANNKNPWRQAKTEQEARKGFKEAFPALHDHISELEDKLRPRADQGRWWWELRACTYYAELNHTKAVWKETSRYYEWALTDACFYPNKTTFFIPECPKWLLALITSKWAWFFLAFKQATGIGGFLNLQRQFVEMLPVPSVTPFLREKLEESIHFAALKKTPSLAEYWHHAAQDITAVAFGLSAADRDLVEAWFRRRSVRGFNRDGTPIGDDLEDREIEEEDA